MWFHIGYALFRSFYISSFDDLQISAIRRKILVTGPNVRHITVRKEGRKDGWMDGWIDGRMDGWMDRCMDGRVDGRMNGWMDG